MGPGTERTQHHALGRTQTRTGGARRGGYSVNHSPIIIDFEVNGREPPMMSEGGEDLNDDEIDAFLDRFLDGPDEDNDIHESVYEHLTALLPEES